MRSPDITRLSHNGIKTNILNDQGPVTRCFIGRFDVNIIKHCYINLIFIESFPDL